MHSYTRLHIHAALGTHQQSTPDLVVGQQQNARCNLLLVAPNQQWCTREHVSATHPTHPRNTFLLTQAL
jgi:hypothetical protein